MKTTPLVAPPEAAEVPDFNDGKEWELVEARFYYRIPSGAMLLVDRRLDPLIYDLAGLIQMVQGMRHWMKTELVYKRVDGRGVGIEEDSPNTHFHRKLLVCLNDKNQKKTAWFFEKKNGEWAVE